MNHAYNNNYNLQKQNFRIPPFIRLVFAWSRINGKSFWFIMILAISISAFVLAAHTQWDNQSFSEETVTTKGQILQVDSKMYPLVPKVYTFGYSSDSNDLLNQTASFISKSHYNTGDEINIEYLKDEPSFAKLARQESYILSKKSFFKALSYMLIPAILVSLFYITRFIRFYNYKQFATAKLIHVSVDFRGSQNIFRHLFKFKGSDGIIYNVNKSATDYFGEIREIDGEKYMVTADVEEKFFYPQENPGEAILINHNSRIEKLINKYVFNHPRQ